MLHLTWGEESASFLFFFLSLINCSTGIVASNPIAFWSVACTQKESCQEFTRNSRPKTYEKIAEFSLGA